MADDYWTKFYQDVGIGKPAPGSELGFEMQPGYTLDQIYKGIIPSTPAVDPMWAEQGMTGAGVKPASPVMLANQPNGSVVWGKNESRLPANAFGYGTNGASGRVPTAVAAIDSAVPRFKPFASAYRAPARFASANTGGADDGILDLSSLDPTERGAQGIADSEGKPIRVKGGRVYYPGGQAPAGKVSGTLGRDTRGPLSQALGLKTSGLSGLFGSLFGGGQGGGLFGSGTPQAQAPRNSAGRPIAVSGPVIGNAVHGTTASGSTGDYGSSPGQITAGLRPGERSYDPDTNSWGLKR